MTWIAVLVLCLSLPCIIHASKMCRDDDDCADLGDVFCMKSRCDWGLCGCPRGQAMRFLGSEKLFQCVPIRRVGESCSTDGDAGVCGAQNSQCIDGRCECSTLGGSQTYPYWGGERCETQPESVSGETCSASLGTCSLSGTNSRGCITGDFWWPGESPLDTLANTCGCGDGYRVALENDFDDHAFTGKTLPRCVRIKFDELCLRDQDCPATMDCVNNKCECRTAGHVPDIHGLTCSVSLGAGAICQSITTAVTGHCDGTKFLVCGDLCDVENYQDNTVDKRCVCDHSYGGPGSSCTKATEDSTCDTDIQCKSLSRTGVCVEGQCKAGAGAIAASLVLLVVALLVSLRVTS